MRFSKLSLPGSVTALGLAALAFLPAPAPALDGPAWWDVRIHLETRGRYALTRDMTDFAGEFVYESVWTGSMEKSDLDYLLYHASLETIRWELKERSGRDGLGALLSENDTPLRPIFRMNYVLGEEDRLHFFFTVEGFPVPWNDSAEKFALIFPCSRKESAASAAAGYDDAVSEGTNDVSLDAKELRNGPVKRVFRWAWKRYHPSSAPPPAGPFLSTHETKVTLKVTPRQGQALG